MPLSQTHAHTQQERPTPAPWAFICLFTFDSLSRSVLLTLIPLKAYALLQDAKLVSLIYFTTAIMGLVAILCIPQFMHKIQRRSLLFAGAAIHLTGVTLLSLNHIPTLVLGLVLQALATASMDFTLSLYLLDNIPRRNLQNFEAKRLVVAGGCFAAGPWIGVTLSQHVADHAGYWVSGLSVASLVIMFILTGIIRTESLNSSQTPLPNPLNAVHRFVKQPRLRLSWLLAFGRNSWWLIYFIYAPIYTRQAGYGAELGGFIVTLGMLPLLLARVWARLAKKFSMRKLMMTAYGSTAFLSMIAALCALFDQPSACLVLLVLAAFAATVIDGGGNVPFLRAVKPLDRPAMTSVFMTFRHVGPIVMPGIMTIALWFLPLPFVFIISGLLTLAMAMLALYLPRGM
jgi:MFS family permease